jgi:hypothetical protein
MRSVISENKSLNKTIGETLRRIRVSRGHPLTIAHHIRDMYSIKLDPSYLSRMELGKAEVPLRTLTALADYYQISLQEILKHSDPNEKILKGISHIVENDQVHSSLLILIEELGEEKTLNLVKGYLLRIIDLVQDIEDRQKTVGAAGPNAKKRIRKLKF